MDKKVGKGKMDKYSGAIEKKTLPAFVKYGLIAVAVIAAVVIGLVIYLNVAGGYVATIDGQKIKTGEFQYYFLNQKQTMFQNAYYANSGNLTEETFWATPIGGTDAVEVAKSLTLDAVRDIKIQYIKAKEAKVTLTKDEIKSIDDSIQKNIIDVMDPDNNNAAGKGNKIRANKAIVKQYGFTLDDLRNVQLENLTIQKYRNTLITDEDANVEANYAKHPEWYKEDTEMRTDAEEAVWARHILIKSDESDAQEDKDAAKKKAEDLIAKLKEGADFAALARENTEDDGSKDVGGEYLFGKGRMVESFEKAAFELKPGQITETPVLTQHGYHIIKLEEKYAQGEPVSLRCAQEYNEYSGMAFVKYKLYMEKFDEWAKDGKYIINKNTAVYDSIK